MEPITVIVWACVGIFLFIAIISLLHILGVYTLPNAEHGNVLFKALVLEVVVVSVAAFASYLSGSAKSSDLEPKNAPGETKQDRGIQRRAELEQDKVLGVAGVKKGHMAKEGAAKVAIEPKAEQSAVKAEKRRKVKDVAKAEEGRKAKQDPAEKEKERKAKQDATKAEKERKAKQDAAKAEKERKARMAKNLVYTVPPEIQIAYFESLPSRRLTVEQLASESGVVLSCEEMENRREVFDRIVCVKPPVGWGFVPFGVVSADEPWILFDGRARSDYSPFEEIKKVVDYQRSEKICIKANCFTRADSMTLNVSVEKNDVVRHISGE